MRTPASWHPRVKDLISISETYTRDLDGKAYAKKAEVSSKRAYSICFYVKISQGCSVGYKSMRQLSECLTTRTRRNGKLLQVCMLSDIWPLW
ncbi:hypothetical protein AB3S75_046038 [Citrus x aurantiifolia]